MNAQPDDTSADVRQSFAELLTPPPMPGTVEFNVANPTPGAALLQTPSFLQKVQSSSQNNLANLAGNTAGPSNFNIPPPFTPPGMKAGIGAVIKSTPQVLKRQETQMKTDEPNTQSPSPIEKSHVPALMPAKSKTI